MPKTHRNLSIAFTAVLFVVIGAAAGMVAMPSSASSAEGLSDANRLARLLAWESLVRVHGNAADPASQPDRQPRPRGGSGRWDVYYEQRRLARAQQAHEYFLLESDQDRQAYLERRLQEANTPADLHAASASAVLPPTPVATEIPPVSDEQIREYVRALRWQSYRANGSWRHARRYRHR